MLNPESFRPAGFPAVAGRLALGLVVAALLIATAGADSVEQQARHYRIPAGPLAPALNRFALEAGVVMYFDPALASGKTTGGLDGAYTVREGFVALLRGTGLEVRAEEPGGYTLRAGDEDGGRRLSEVRVQGKVDPRAGIYGEPGAVSMVTREDIDRLPPRNTSDVLAAVPGVHTSQSRQDPGVSVNIRGLQDFGRVNVMIDGTRQNFQKSGHGSNGQVYLDPELLAGVDVAKGPTSTVGGAGVIGGVVNFRTLEFSDLARDGANHGARLNATTGDNAYHFSGSIAGATRVTDNLDLVAAVSRKNVGAFDKGERGPKEGGYWHGTSQFTGQDQWSALFKSTLRVGDNQRLKFSYVGLQAQFDQGSNTSTLAGATDHNRVRSDTFLVNYSLFPASGWLDLDSSLYYTRTRNDQKRPQSGDPDDPYGAFAVRYETNTVGGALSNRTPLSPVDWPASLDLSYGLEFYHDWTRPDATQTSDGEGEASWFSGPTPEGERSVASLFSQLRFAHSSGAELIAGLRYDYFRLEGEGQMYVGSETNPPGTRPPTTSLYTDFGVARHDGFFSPTLTAAWQLTNPLQLFASYGRGVRPPAITETLMWGSHIGNSFPFFPNPGLEPERSTNWEAGANLRLANLIADDDRLRLKAAWFDTRVDHYITQGFIAGPADTTGSGMAIGFVNLEDQVRFRGLELRAEYDLGAAFAELSWTRTLHDLGRGGYDPYPLGSLHGYPETDHGEPNGGGMIYLLPPRKKGTLSTGVRLFDRRLTLGARARYEDNDGRGGGMYEDVVDWTVYDLWASYEPTDTLTLRLAVDNLRDRNYAELNGTSYWIAPGRTVTGTLSLRF